MGTHSEWQYERNVYYGKEVNKRAVTIKIHVKTTKQQNSLSKNNP